MWIKFFYNESSSLNKNLAKNKYRFVSVLACSREFIHLGKICDIIKDYIQLYNYNLSDYDISGLSFSYELF